MNRCFLPQLHLNFIEPFPLAFDFFSNFESNPQNRSLVFPLFSMFFIIFSRETFTEKPFSESLTDLSRFIPIKVNSIDQK